MRSALAEAKPLRSLGFADRACGVCGWRFFTTLALHEHSYNCPPRPPRPINPVLQDAGRRIAAHNNSRRRRCDECGHESTAAGIGSHQKAKGHQGLTDVS